MEDTLLFSVVTVALNEEPRIGTLLRSPDLETERNELEVLLIDNGSKDGTVDIMERYAATRTNVRTFVSKGSLGEAWQFGLDHAHGQYVIFLGADMALPRGTINTLRMLVSRHPSPNAIVAKLSPLFRRQGDLNNYLKGYLLADTGKDGPWKECMFHSGGLVVDRLLAQKVRFDPTLPTSEDGDFSYRFLKSG